MGGRKGELPSPEALKPTVKHVCLDLYCFAVSHVLPHWRQSKKIVKKTKQPIRLYAKGVILGDLAKVARKSHCHQLPILFAALHCKGYKRSKSNCYANCSLLKIDGVRTKAGCTAVLKTGDNCCYDPLF